MHFDSYSRKLQSYLFVVGLYRCAWSCDRLCIPNKTKDMMHTNVFYIIIREQKSLIFPNAFKTRNLRSLSKKIFDPLRLRL